MFDPNGAIPTVSAKAPAVAEIATQHSPTLASMASSILEGLRAIAEHPAIPLEEIGIGVAAIASVAGTVRTIQEYRKDKGEGRLKRDAQRAATHWAQADGSLIAYAANQRVGVEAALISATADINRFIPRSDARAQALDIAMKMPLQERAETAAGMEGALAGFVKAIPKDAGVAHNHAKLARLAGSPLEAAAAAERAAFGAIERKDPTTAKGREACFALLQAAACRAVALERGEVALAPVVAAPPPPLRSGRRRGDGAR